MGDHDLSRYRIVASYVLIIHKCYVSLLSTAGVWMEQAVGNSEVCPGLPQ